MIYISNAFSLQMLNTAKKCKVTVTPVDADVIDTVSGMIAEGKAVSAIGHEDTARLLGLPFNRTSVRLTPSDVLYVVQVIGGRLPEGCTTLPEGVEFRYLRVEIEY